MEDPESLTDVLDSLSIEARELYLPAKVSYLDLPPTPIEFFREWVTPNIPVVIGNAINHWPALKSWNANYFRKRLGHKVVTVAVTPNGYADAVVGDKFVMPEERPMKFEHFLDILDKKANDKGIYYVQKQNSNFTEEFVEIIGDAEMDIKWASEAFGKLPDAVNFWMGDKRAITSMHKDHYENVYCVVSGTKTFTLIPPTDLAFIPYGLYKPAKYQRNSIGEFEIVEQQKTDQSDYFSEAQHSYVPWISIDPLNPDLKAFPDYVKAKPITCTVSAGEMLYLPSLWFHHVQQSHGCVAVNFWYDMEYGIKYNYFKFVENITHIWNKSKTG